MEPAGAHCTPAGSDCTPTGPASARDELRWSNGFVRKRLDKGRWQLCSSTQVCGSQVTTSKMSSVPCNDRDNKGKATAARELSIWVQSLNMDPVAHLSHKWRELYRHEMEGQAAREGSERRHAEPGEETRPQSDALAPSITDIPFVDFMEGYLQHKYHELGEIEESTYVDYRRSFGKAREFFGNTPLRDIDRGCLQDYISWLVDKGLSPYTVWRHLAPVTQAARYAWIEGLIATDRNPVDGLRKPKKVKAKPSNPIPMAEIPETWKKLCSVTPTNSVVEGMKVMLVCGLRTAEVCGLMWEHVVIFPKDGQGNETGGYLAVVQSVAKGEQGYYIKVPKTAHGRRAAYFGPSLAASLRSWRTACVRRLLDIGAVPPGTDPLAAAPFVCGTESGRFMDPLSFSKRYSMLSQVLGIRGLVGTPTKAYDFRRSNAGILNLSPDADPKSVTEMFGHSSIDFTRDVYVSADPTGLNRTAGAVDDLVSGRAPLGQARQQIALDAFPTAIDLSRQRRS